MSAPPVQPPSVQPWLSGSRADVPTTDWRLSRFMANPSSSAPESHWAGLDAYHRLGGNCIYVHGEGGETHTRETTGRWLRERHLRSRFFLSTQVCHDDWDEMNQRPIGRFTALGLEEDVRKDLELIGTGRIDLIGLSHHPNLPVEPVIDAVRREISAGRVGGYGFCNWPAARIHEAADYAGRSGAPRPAAVFTTELSLLRSTEPLWPEYPPFSQELEAAVIAHRLWVLAHVGDLNLGQCLLGEEDAISRLRPRWMTRWQHPENPRIVERIRKYSAEKGLTPREVNLAWVLHRSFPVVAIAGLPSMLTERRIEYERVTERTFDTEELDRLRLN